MSSSGVRTGPFPAILEAALREDPGRPLVTAYDDATGDRTELSVLTYANWVAKTANLLVEEYLLDDGDTMLVDLPTHWLTTVFLGAAWTAGITVCTDPRIPAHLVVCGPEHDRYADSQTPVLACSLSPFAGRFGDELPDGVDDFGALWPGQADVFAPLDPPTAGTVAWRHRDTTYNHGQLTEMAATAGWPGDRLLTDVVPTADCGTSTFLAAMVRGGSLVLVANPEEELWPRHAEEERATAQFRGR